MLLDRNQVAMLENALYSVCPPITEFRPKRQKTILEEYVTFLLVEQLEISTNQDILVALRSFDWDDLEVSLFFFILQTRRIIKSVFLKPWKIKHLIIPRLVQVLNDLQPFRPSFIVELVDEALELFLFMLGFSSSRFNQKSVAMAEFLGNMYQYDTIEADTIFGLLRVILSIDPNLEDIVKSSRIYLACLLLSCCKNKLANQEFKPAIRKVMSLIEFYTLSIRNNDQALETMIGSILDFFQEKKMAKNFDDAAKIVESAFGLKVEIDSALGNECMNSDIGEAYEDSNISSPKNPVSLEAAYNAILQESLELSKLERRKTTFDIVAPSGTVAQKGHVSILLKKKNKAITKSLPIEEK